MMTRTDILAQLATHPWLHRVWNRMTEAEQDQARLFIQAHDALDAEEFQRAINRMHLDQPKPKHWKEIEECLSCANTEAWQRRRS